MADGFQISQKVLLCVGQQTGAALLPQRTRTLPEPQHAHASVNSAGCPMWGMRLEPYVHNHAGAADVHTENRNVPDFYALQASNWPSRLATTYFKNQALVSQLCYPVELGQNTHHVIWSNTQTQSTKSTSREEEKEEIIQPVNCCPLSSKCSQTRRISIMTRAASAATCCSAASSITPPSVLPSTHSLYLYSRLPSLQTSGRLAETRACATPAVGYLEEPREKTFKRSTWLLKRWGCFNPAFIQHCHIYVTVAGLKLNICFVEFPLKFVRLLAEPHLCRCHMKLGGPTALTSGHLQPGCSQFDWKGLKY